MSDLSSVSSVTESCSQLPASWYFNSDIYRLEETLFFNRGPAYVGHELMVPNVGDYHSLEWLDNARVLVLTAEGIELLSNICRHSQAIMLQGRGTVRNIVCPIHRWTYALAGKL